tara:strand:- start:1158 stop:1268 length:111 start_codon:yes stop_codon:yes gene_type:complete
MALINLPRVGCGVAEAGVVVIETGDGADAGAGLAGY